MSRKVAIVGAGVGGLATAARLAYRGYEVEVYEKLPCCGGRNNIIEDRGFKFDMGPSFVLMPDFFEEIFSYCGKDMGDHIDLKCLDINYRIFYPDGDALTVYGDSDKKKEEFEKIEHNSAYNYDRFIEETGRIYKKVKPLLWRCFTPYSLFNPYYWFLVNKIRAFESYWQLARRFFYSEKLCFAFTFEAMFIGVSPFRAPAFYSIISYADHAQRIHHPVGGMYQIPLALERLAVNFGTKFHYNTQIQRIAKRNNSIILETLDREIKTDKAVVNADYAYAESELLGRKIPDFEYSCSVYLIYLGLKKKVAGLEHHNLFFGRDLRKNLKQIFEDKTIPYDPSFYVHVPTVTDRLLAPEGKDILYILIPVPNLKDHKEDIKNHEEALRRAVFYKLDKTLGIKVEDLIEIEHRFYPQDFISRYNVKYGATFGIAHNLMQSAFFRPANFDKKIKGLYFVGASTQPGGGLPVVIAGSRIVADLITGGW